MDPEPLIAPRRSLSEEVYRVLLGMLMDQKLTPGSRINIDALARQLGVSPTPVREALTRLESEGLVTKQTLKGYTVGDLLDQEGLRQLFDVRALLEPYSAREAAAVIDDDTLERLAELGDQMRELAGNPTIGEDGRFQDYRDFASFDGEFHQLISDRSGNALVADALERLHSHIHLYRLYFRQGLAAATIDEHQAIYDALAKSDGQAAELAMKEHIDRSHARIAAYADQAESRSR